MTLLQAHDRLSSLERESLSQLAALESALGVARTELEEVLEGRRQVEEEVQTLRRVVSSQQKESQNRQSLLEDKIQELISRTSPDSGNNSYFCSFSLYCDIHVSLFKS